MKVTVDTSVLVRGLVRDDSKQASSVDKILKEASLIAVSLPCLCEFVWVLRRVYSFDNELIASAIRALLDTGKVVMNRPAVEVGLAMLEAGGDFADGIMAHEGTWLGGETFVSFDRKAVRFLSQQGEAAQLLS
ncbi:type II toxin-antitoxin system VapC family toxin [Rhizobium sp. LCM 4573]|uniref:type II toxin-antitoxin system VapC family toxin n=1 Tax=Rhizobium sp. LCM 4573 TaxID=1848291 RepID=UPI0008DAF2EC|nr:type II toxin-antitoxin system VapC family toxin [Rhizobium sp. LCM 4573]OHV77066.1 DNA-binding protein [Rhizobium sp. LCM 4573]